MIPVYICDDELPIRKNLEQIVGNQILILDSDMGPVRALEDPEELLVLQRQDSVPAIYFLDIDFPGKMSGLELAQKLRQYDPRGFIVFITAHNDLAFETFRLRLEALDYIVKGDGNRCESQHLSGLRAELFAGEHPGTDGVSAPRTGQLLYREDPGHRAAHPHRQHPLSGGGGSAAYPADAPGQ